MKSAVRRSVLVCAPALALTLGGCAIHEQTQGWYPRYEGVLAEAGEIGLRNVLVITSDGQATVLASFANTGPEDRLVEVVIDGAPATFADGPLEIPARGYATLGPEGTFVEASGVDLTPGLLVDVEFRFENAPRTTVQTLAHEADGRYAHIEFPETGAPDATNATD